ncbi:MAG: hypothetical protein ACAI44_23045 [Candidatus Sericytochromatia bacterium]
MTAPQPRLQPRLFMLAHSGRHLLAQLQSARQLQRTFCEYLCPVAIGWNLLQQQATPLRQTQVESLQPLSLPALAGISARLQSQPLTTAASDTLYQLPDLSFELLDPQGQATRSTSMSCGRFRTFASGQPERQLLEFMAATLSYELSEWGFSCMRQRKQLLFSAHPALAGWNLALTELSFPPGDLPQSSCGLRAGLSSSGSGQTSGRLAYVHWGPWLINGQRCELALPFSNDIDHFSTAFAAALNQQLSDAAVVWTPDRHLMLLPRRPGEPLEIAALPPSEVQAPDLPLDLPLPTGHFGPDHQVQPLGEFELNGTAIVLAQPADSPDAAWLCESINRHSPRTGVHAEITSEQHLHLQALHPHQPLIISAVSDLLQRALGLQAMRLGELDYAGLIAALERWTLLLNQVLADLPAPLAQALQSAGAEVPPLAGNFSDGLFWNEAALEHSLEPILAYLESVMIALELCLQAPETQSVQNLRPLQLELEMTQGPLRNLTETESGTEPPPRSTFDHKI